MALLPVDEALARVLDGVTPLSVESADLLGAAGRVLAQDIAAGLTQPPFNASAMDGYAVRAANVAVVPSELRIIGESNAGGPYAGSVGPGETARIFTGASVPRGADAVVIQDRSSQATLSYPDDSRAVSARARKVFSKHDPTFFATNTCS
jgi:molybdopterin molybdotransferase